MSLNVYIQDADEREAPPGQPVLEVGVGGDTIFLAIGRWEESTNERRFVTSPDQQVSVLSQDLVNAVVAAQNSDSA